MPSDGIRAQFVDGQLISFKVREHLSDIRHHRLAGPDQCKRFGIFAGSFGVDLGDSSFVDPSPYIGADVGQQLGLGRRIRHQNRKVSVVGVEIRNRAFVGLDEVIFAGQEIATVLFFHLENGALQLRQKIENLRRLGRPLLIMHALIELDLLFVL